MTVNLKRGLFEGVVVAAICSGLFVVISWRNSPEWAFRSSDLNTVLLIACSTGLLGFLAGAFRSTPAPPEK
jgi:hypothetical protein